MKRALLLVCAVFFLFGYGYSAAKQEKTVTLMVYSGAGLKKPMEKIKEQFEKENPSVQLTMIYAQGRGSFWRNWKNREKAMYLSSVQNPRMTLPSYSVYNACVQWG